jgi:uncharacterized protein (UPF0332 family)
MITNVHLSEDEAAALTEYIQRLDQQYDGNLLLAILYGSKARGDADPDSDIDVLTVVRYLDDECERGISHIASDIGLAHNVLLAPRVMSEPHYRQLAEGKFTFYRNIQRDGLILYPIEDAALPEPYPSGIIPALKTKPLIHEDKSGYMSPKEVKLYLDRAKEALQTAVVNINECLYNGAVNRAYYAIFYAASAALASRGIGRSKHSGVRSAFGYEFLRTGIIGPEYGPIYDDAMKAREKSDYDVHISTDEATARRILADAHKFVMRIEDYLRAVGIV